MTALSRSDNDFEWLGPTGHTLASRALNSRRTISAAVRVGRAAVRVGRAAARSLVSSVFHRETRVRPGARRQTGCYRHAIWRATRVPLGVGGAFSCRDPMPTLGVPGDLIYRGPESRESSRYI